MNQLPKLTELSLESLHLNKAISTTGSSNHFVPTIRKLNLYECDDLHGESLFRLFGKVFPAVEELTIQSARHLEIHTDASLFASQHFRFLRQHHIGPVKVDLYREVLCRRLVESWDGSEYEFDDEQSDLNYLMDGEEIDDEEDPMVELYYQTYQFF